MPILLLIRNGSGIENRRIAKSIDWDGDGSGSADVVQYVYDGDSIILAFDGSDALTNRYLQGPMVDQILADEDALGNVLWPLADNLGSVRDIVDSDGAVQNHITYDSYANITSETNTSVHEIYGFTGRERDEESELQFNRARYYDPRVGQWISQDPIGFRANDANLQRYVANAPTDFTAASGRLPASEMPEGVRITLHRLALERQMAEFRQLFEEPVEELDSRNVVHPPMVRNNLPWLPPGWPWTPSQPPRPPLNEP